MKNFLNSKFLVNSISTIIILLITIFLLLRLRYAIIVNDDMMDLVSNKWVFFHGRYIMEFLGTFFVIILPQFFNINIQDFAIVSQGIMKIAGFDFLIYSLSSQFYKSNIKNIGFCFIIVFSFFMIFSILVNIDYIWGFDTYQYFFGYIGAIVFFLLFFQKIYDFYLMNKTAEKKDFLTIFILSILVATSNELFSIVCIFLLLIILLDLLYSKENNNIKILLFSFFIISLTTLFSILSNGSRILWDVYSLKINFSSLYNELITFLQIFVKYTIKNNIYSIIPIILCYIVLIIRHCNNTKTIKILKYSTFTLLGFNIFLFGTILLPKTCIYTDLANKYWLLHKGLLTDFSVILFSILLFLLGHVISVEKNIKFKILIIGFSILSCLCFIVQNFSFEKIRCMHSYKSIKTTMYMNDKISLFYLKRGKTIVLPKEQFFYIIPEIHPDELMSNKQIYKQIYDKERARYLIYLERNYKVNVSSNITFLPYKDAMQKYKKLGGNFSEEELKNLKFSRLNNL